MALNGNKLIFKGIHRASHLPDVFTNLTNGSKEKGNKCFIFDKQLACLAGKKISKYDQKVISLNKDWIKYCTVNFPIIFISPRRNK